MSTVSNFFLDSEEATGQIPLWLAIAYTKHALQCFYLNPIVKKEARWTEIGIFQQLYQFYWDFRYFSIIDSLVHTYDVPKTIFTEFYLNPIVKK